MAEESYPEDVPGHRQHLEEVCVAAICDGAGSSHLPVFSTIVALELGSGRSRVGTPVVSSLLGSLHLAVSSTITASIACLGLTQSELLLSLPFRDEDG